MSYAIVWTRKVQKTAGSTVLKQEQMACCKRLLLGN